MSRTFFISDLHFSHKNILKYEPIRTQLIKQFFPILSIENMTEEELLEFHDNMLIKKWNQVVRKDDTVWFLGDFAMGSRTHIAELIKRLNGRKRMIMGNHDNFPKSFYEENGFEYVSKYPVVLKGKFILSHAPIQLSTGEMYNIYGHVHGNPNFPTETPTSRCVSVERQEGYPIELEIFNNYNPTPVENH